MVDGAADHARLLGRYVRDGLAHEAALGAPGLAVEHVERDGPVADVREPDRARPDVPVERVGPDLAVRDAERVQAARG